MHPLEKKVFKFIKYSGGFVMLDQVISAFPDEAKEVLIEVLDGMCKKGTLAGSSSIGGFGILY